MKIEYANCEGCASKDVCKYQNSHIQLVKDTAENYGDKFPWVDRIYIGCSYFNSFFGQLTTQENVNRINKLNQAPFPFENANQRLVQMNPSTTMIAQQHPSPQPTPDAIEQYKELLNKQAKEAQQQVKNE